jgi:hypothetical protein
MYALPATAGWGQHWELEEDEAAELAESARDVLAAFPVEDIEWLIRIIEKITPAAILAWTLKEVTVKRVKQTRELRREKRERERQQRQQPQPQNGQAEAGRVYSFSGGANEQQRQ